MSNWITITIATLNEASIAALITACDTAALADNQAPRSAGLIQGVVDDIRRKVASNSKNRLDTDPTKIPKGLKGIAVTLINAKLNIAITNELNEDQRREVSTANQNLNRVASGDDVVEQPDDPLPSYEEMQTSNGVTHKAGKRKASAKKMDGLI
ncbi:MAG TPA: hypothetical protein VG347_04285 [Verrucomicrobiae bacterium]|nr:hypothetical protein [Verrucomicrobiae bacterium]